MEDLFATAKLRVIRLVRMIISLIFKGRPTYILESLLLLFCEYARDMMGPVVYWGSGAPRRVL